MNAAVKDPCVAIDSMAASMQAASTVMRQATERILNLELALDRLIRLVDDVSDDTEGHHPSPDSGCLECTAGTVPYRYNTGLCAYHNAKKLIGKL